MKHIDDFINDPFNDEDYAQWVLHYFRLPATLKNKFRKFMSDNLLFCSYKYKRYRVTGASRLGDIWLAKNFEQEYGYDIRVNIDDCYDWGDKP